MATLWSCAGADCPPTGIDPVDVPESGDFTPRGVTYA
jgi:hypothetical protein